MKLKGRNIFSFMLLLLFVVGFIFSLNWSGKARLFPLLITVTGTILALCLFVSELTSQKSKHLIENVSKNEEIKISIRFDKKNVTFVSELAIILWILGFLCLVLLLGFWIAVIIFIPFFMSFFGQENVKITILLTLSIWMVIYLIFYVALSIPLYGGLLGLTW